MNIPFLGSTYQGRSVNIDASRSVNWYPELTQDQENGKANISMVGTPGLSVFTLAIGASASPVRGLYTFNGIMYGVIDNKLYSINSSGVGTARGTLSTSSGRVDFTNNGAAANGVGGDQLLIVDGTDGYIYNITSTVFTTLPSTGGWADLKAGGHKPLHCEFLDGYFIVTNGTMSYWVSNLYDGLTWNALATASVTATPDSIQAIVNHRQQLFFIKQWSTEIWADAGTPTSQGSPFTRVGGAVYDFGVAAPWSIAKGGPSIYFLCTQRTADGGETIGVAEITDYSPVMISPPAINYKLSTSTTHANCFGYCYAEQGHIFYVLTNPDDNFTLVYDVTTKMWHERSSLMNDFTTVNRHLGNCYTFFNNKHYVGDYRNSNIYEMSSSYMTDAGLPIYSFRTAQTIIDPQLHNNVFISKLIVDAETGVGTNTPVIVAVTPYPAGWNGSANVLIKADGSITAGAMLVGSTDPQATLSWSNDAGHTWSADYPVSLGTQGSYTARLVWRRLGKARDRVFKLGISAGVKKILIAAYTEAST